MKRLIAIAALLLTTAACGSTHEAKPIDVAQSHVIKTQPVKPYTIDQVGNAFGCTPVLEGSEPGTETEVTCGKFYMVDFSTLTTDPEEAKGWAKDWVKMYEAEGTGDVCESTGEGQFIYACGPKPAVDNGLSALGQQQ